MTGEPRRTLPARYYTDRGLFAKEQERFFSDMWVCAGREQDVATAGMYVLRDVAGESVIVTRDEAGHLRAFYNVCRHRGTRLSTDMAGQFAGRIRCPYHAWTYGLDGALVSAPHMDGTPGFRCEDIALAAVGVDVWDGHVFLTLNPSATPLTAHLGDLPARCSAWGMGALRRAYRATYDVRANWKLIVQNYSECLHSPVVHPALQQLSHVMTGDNDLPGDTVLGGRVALRAGVETLSRTGRRRRAVLPGLGETEARHVYYYAVLPNLLLSLHPDYVMTHLLWPKAPDLTEVWCEWHFHPREFEQPAFDPADAIDFWDDTNREDWRVSELSQLGIASRAYTPGPYSPREGLLREFDRIVRRKLGETEEGD